MLGEYLYIKSCEFRCFSQRHGEYQLKREEVWIVKNWGQSFHFGA